MGASICLCQGPSRAVLNLHLVRRSGVEMQTLPMKNLPVNNETFCVLGCAAAVGVLCVLRRPGGDKRFAARPGG